MSTLLYIGHYPHPCIPSYATIGIGKLVQNAGPKETQKRDNFGHINW